MNNYILLYNQACTLERTLRSKTQVDNDEAFSQRKSNGTQIEQELSDALLYLPHSWKPSQISRYCLVPRIFVRGTRKRVGGDPKKLFATGKACGRQSTKVFIREMLYFNQFRKFSLEVLDRRSHWVCDHAHPPRPRTTWNANSSENPDAYQLIALLMEIIASCLELCGKTLYVLIPTHWFLMHSLCGGGTYSQTTSGLLNPCVIGYHKFARN